LLKYLPFRSSRLVLLAMVSSGMLLTTSCSGSPLSLLTGGGPNVAANVQAGKTNTQTIGSTSVTEQKLVRPKARTIRQSNDKTRVQTESAETVIVNDLPVWVWMVALVLFVVGWVTDTPATMVRQMIKRKQD